MPQLHDPFRSITTSASCPPDATHDTSNPTDTLDALIIGAGFGGVYQLHTLRAAGFNAKLIEAGQDYGGVWHWNRYPGIRVDIDVRSYQYAAPEVWKDWDFKTRFPDGEELRDYFQHVADVWDIRPYTEFGVWVVGARWDNEGRVWVVRTSKVGGDGKDGRGEGKGSEYRARWLLPCTGFASKRQFPDWKGIDTFEGKLIHPSYWPHEQPELEGKRIAVIGTGATGVQIIQSLAPVASQLTVFQRTPNTAMPMKQETYDPPRTTCCPKDELQSILDKRTSSFAGIEHNPSLKKTFEDTEEDRAKFYESLWSDGSLKLWLGNYADMLSDPAANDCVYNFWRDKTRTRINDARVRDLLAPMQKPYAFGTKRIPLETSYFECFNEPHVSLIDVNTTPVTEVTASSIKIKTEDGSEIDLDFDIIIPATGYDSITGGLVQMNLLSETGQPLGEYWKDGVQTTLGLAVPGFPNMVFTYGPQSPTALWSGVACAEATGEWVRRVMLEAKRRGVDKMVPTEESGREWRKITDEIAGKTLLPETNSWYTGANVPGKVKQPLFFLGGAPDYMKRLDEAFTKGLAEFELWSGSKKVEGLGSTAETSG